MIIINLESNRLNFRKYKDHDFDFLFSLLSDPEMMRHIGEGKTRDRKGTKRFLDWIYNTYEIGTDKGLMVLEDKDDNTPIGHAGLVPQKIEGVEELEIGYWISREYWGKGYATEAAKSLLDYGQNHLQEERLISLIQRENKASKSIANKLGMRLEKEIKLNGQNVCVYSISR
ncbi:GNAT family N-acetyltransferase [Pontibacillus marinus]|uniref:Acetyltransferase n=1 Tax=Pontibacillus marinus BH030004 = DSM 16465 TaxID=1385511 RepID=A0A0A5GGC0_9BACI|nr:GNAT family N-acetyltransferase [Pontibacillus marinus]KGX90160.1 acetyltransferase [Pontibacillus marinus BH030004 = DSM 16465]